jgi:hypothetical protein
MVMAGAAKAVSRASFSWGEPDLRRDAPESLRGARPVRSPFDHARCPYVSAQLKAAAKTEAQRREESGRGSLMVKLHRPFPDLRPRNENQPIREAFNAAWLKEDRAARLAQFRKEREGTNEERAQSPGIARGRER